MAIKWYCDQCEKELTEQVKCWTTYGPEGPYHFCSEECLFGWLLDREMGREEAEEEAEVKGKKEKLVCAVEMVLNACHDYLDEECENAT